MRARADNYPLSASQPWPREQWYVAATGEEVAATPIERTILEERVMLFRTEAGKAVALGGLCPHRFMPLTGGKRTGDTIECPYHGMTFDAAGNCTGGPALSAPVAAARLRSYPVVERGPFIWVWTGAPERCDESLLPDGTQCGLDADGWRIDLNGVDRFNARYMLMIDNLFDLSHIGWIHETTVGRLPIVTQPATLIGDGPLPWFERREVAPVDPFTQMLFPNCIGPIGNKLATRMLGVGLVTAIGPSIVEAEGSPIAGKDWGTVHFVHAITPETRNVTRIHLAVARDFRQDDDQLSAALCAQNRAVIEQDRVAIETVERALAEAKVDTELSFRSDRGGIEARRAIDRMIESESDLQPA